MHLDARGLPVSTASAEATAAYDYLVTGYLTYRADTPARLNALLEAELPEEGDWDSVGGLVYHLLGHVPAEAESVEIEGYRLSAEKVQGRRIGRVRITPLPGSTGPSDEGGIDVDWVPTR